MLVNGKKVSTAAQSWLNARILYSQKLSTAVQPMLVHSPKISTTVQKIAQTRLRRSALFASLDTDWLGGHIILNILVVITRYEGIYSTDKSRLFYFSFKSFL